MKFNLLVIAMSGTFLLAACNLGKSPEPTQDVNAIYTSVAETTMAQFNVQQTQTAQAVPSATATAPATFTPLPTFPVLSGVTPLATFPSGGTTPIASPVLGGGTGGSTAVGCNDSAFVAETIPDGTTFSPGKNFTKTWQLQNTGTCAWDQGYAFTFVDGDHMSGADVTFKKSGDTTDPGHSQSFNIPLVAPSQAGEYKGYWQMQDDQGIAFGSRVWVDIVVK